MPPPPPPSSIPPPPGFQPAAPGVPPAPAPAGRSKLPWLIGGAVVVAAIVVAAVVFMGGDDSTGGKKPDDIANAADVINGLIGDAVFEEGGDSSEIGDCVVPMENLVRKAPASTSLSAYEHKEGFAAVVLPDGSNMALIECSSTEDGGGLVGISLGGPTNRADFAAGMESYLPNFDVEFDAFKSYRGGTIVTYCGTPKPDAEDGFDAFCEADWFDDQIVVGIFAGPEQASKAEISEWLKVSLDFMITAVAAS